MELDGPWADHSSFRNSSSSSESVSAVKVVFNKVSHGALGGDEASLVTLSGSENALARAGAERSECLPAVQQAMSHRLDLFSLAWNLTLAWEAPGPQAS